MKLTGPKIKRLPDGEHGDERGLYLRLTSGTGSWGYRYQMNGRRRVMALGSYPEIGLAAARRLSG